MASVSFFARSAAPSVIPTRACAARYDRQRYRGRHLIEKALLPPQGLPLGCVALATTLTFWL
jgi:hypothetical protein